MGILDILQGGADKLAADKAKFGPSGIPVDEAGYKTDPLGRGIDNFLRNLLGGEGVGGQPTEMLGIMPQAPALGSPVTGQLRGIQVGPNTLD